MIEVLPHRCQPFLYNEAGCRLCVEACPEECITFDGSPEVDRDRCTSCGLCTAICPSGALRVEGFNDIDLWGRLKELTDGKEFAVLTCSGEEEVKAAKLKRGSALIRFSCVGLVKDVHLFGLFLLGMKKVILRSCCKDCTSPRGRKVLLKTVEDTKALLKIFNVDGEVMVVEDLPEEEKGKRVEAETIHPAPHYSRRKFFSLFAERAKALREEMEEDDEEEVNFLPDADLSERRQLLIDMVKGGDIGIEGKGSYSAYEIEIDERCSLCNICDLFCPTGALDRVESEERVKIELTPAYCVGCYQCEELCPEGALHCEREVEANILSLTERTVLVERSKISCSSCGKSFLPEGEERLCLSCRKKKKREELFFAMIGVGD